MSEDRLSIESAVISDPDGVIVFEIQNSISDMEIFEHLDKPYLTGQVTFLDSYGVLDKMQFKGVEKFEVELAYPYLEDEPVRKTFIIDRIINTTKKNDKAELITFHIIEEHGFMSTFLNVNKAYEGSSRQIVEKIMLDYFEDYSLSEEDVDEMKDNMKVVVPNMTPLEACNWIKDRTTSISGTPYYFFSTLSNLKTLHFLSLSTMLDNQNSDTREYYYSQSLSGAGDVSDRPYVIEDYRSNNNGDISNLIDKSLIGSEYGVINTVNGEVRKIPFDSVKKFESTPTLQELSKDSFIYNTDYTYKDKRLNEIASRKTFTVMTGQSYPDHKSFRETSSPTNAFWAKSLRSILTSTPIDIAVSGQTFLDSQINKSIGNLIKIRFLNNNVSSESNDLEEVTDKIKSGRHMIYAARHIIRKEKYDVVLSCVKLENLK